MDIPSDLISPLWLGIAWLLYGLALARALIGLAWWRLADSGDSRVFYAAVLLMLMIWIMRAGVTEGLNFHILGVTALTLMFGWRFALLGVSLALLGITVLGRAGWDAFAINAVIMGLLPIVFTQGLLRFAQYRLPLNFFVYVFINAFLAAGLAGLLVGFTSMGLMLLDGVHDYATLAYEYLPYFPLLFFPEAFINGLLMTVMVGLRPQWVSSFRDDMYLKGK